MQELTDGLILYHGSYCEVRNPDLNKCAKRKDFGKGFYLTTSKEQAESFLKTSLRKAEAEGILEVGQDYGIISIFSLNLKHQLKSHIFHEADSEWLHCIAAHRKKNSFLQVKEKMTDYDVIIGKIADDATNRTLTAYLAGAFGEIGSDRADDFCIGQLLPERLQNQYCFRTQKALESLKFERGEKVWIKK